MKPVLLIPASIFHTERFCGDHFSIKFITILLVRFAVELIDGAELFLEVGDVFILVLWSKPEELSGLKQSIDANSEELFIERDESSIINWEHLLSHHVINDSSVRHLVAVDFADLFFEIAPILNQAVHIECDDVD